MASAAARTEPGSLSLLRQDPRALDWNGPAGRDFVRFTDEDMGQSIFALFARVARRQPDRIAVMDADTRLTYSELRDGVTGLAEIIAATTRPDALVGLLLPAGPRCPLAMLACLAAGRPFVALDPHYPREWLDTVLNDARPALIIAGTDEWDNLPATQVIHLDCVPRPASAAWRPAERGLDQPACVLFTSGSSGQPKGIVNSQRNLLQRVAQSINAAHISAQDRLLTLGSLGAIVGVRDVITALLAGASIRLIDSQLTGARDILSVIRADAVSILFAFPALLRSILSTRAERAGDALRLVRIGGDTTLWSDIDLVRAWLQPTAHVQLIYAATEAPMMQWFVDDALRGDDPRIPIGYPLPGNRLAIVDASGRPAAAGEFGELVAVSPHVALGRWKDGRYIAEGAEAGVAPGERVFRTGDIVRQRPDGLLERIGRKDRVVKIRGARVDLDGVEAMLRAHPFVQDAGVHVRQVGDNATLAAYVCARDGAPAALPDHLRETLRDAPPAMRPAHIHLVPRIPRLPSSKLDVEGLAALDEARRGDAPIDAAASDAMEQADGITQTVALVWRNVLNAPAHGPDDDFFDVGGDSLKAIALTLELEQALRLELPVTLINEAPTFGALCAALRDKRTDDYVPLVLLKAGGGAPPVFFIHGVGGNVTEMAPTARLLSYPGPVIGIQARGLTGRDPPHATIHAMAEAYLQEIRARQPHGPYHLCGYSFGGLVAFEIASRLRASGDDVGLVGLFDTMMSPLRWPLRSWLSIARRRAVRLLGRPGAALSHRPPTAGLLRGVPARVLTVASSALVASARYRPGFYEGELTLFSPTDREAGLPSLDAIWRRHARCVTVVETAGTHATMLSAPNALSTATRLDQRLPRG